MENEASLKRVKFCRNCVEVDPPEIQYETLQGRMLLCAVCAQEIVLLSEREALELIANKVIEEDQFGVVAEAAVPTGCQVAYWDKSIDPPRFVMINGIEVVYFVRINEEK